MDAYKEQFLSGVEGAPRAAVKRLTRAIETELTAATINAPDWYVMRNLCTDDGPNLQSRDTLYAARMARDLMWEGDKSINLDEFVTISQTYALFFFLSLVSF
jgi:glycerol-3-phosphate O-acyltransferase/dihydroxyacetone phosphate acyltransferase